MGHLRLPNESDADFGKRRAFETGQLWGPQNPNGPNVKPGDLATLKPEDNEMQQAFVGLSRMMVRDYAYSFAKHYGTTPTFDGKLDAAMLEVMATPRCDVPDYAPPPGAQFQFGDPLVQEVALEMQRRAALPATGRGNWPTCHSIGNYHCCCVQVSMANRPAWATDAVMKPVWKNVQDAYAQRGQWIIYVGTDMKDLLTGEDRSGQHVDTKASWAKSSSGWIGLAIKTLGLGCGDEIWQQYLATYQGGSTDAARIIQNSSLWRHEHGHNSGLDHTNGGTMNPSIINNLPLLWVPSDPSTPILNGWYGGEAVPPPGGTPPPGPGPGPGPLPPLTPDEIRAQLKWLSDKQFEDNITNTVQDIKIKVLTDRLKAAGIP